MFTETYGTVHNVLLNASATYGVKPHSLRMLLAIAERGGTFEGASHKYVGALGSNATTIRRSSLELRAAGLITSTSKRGVGMRLALTLKGRDLSAAMLREIRESLVVPAPELVAA